MLKDEDIQHEYKKYMFPFLFLKWKVDSLIVAIRRNEIFCVLIHWIIVVNTSVLVYLIAQLVAGFFSASILIGNHEKERKFSKRVDVDFFEHQISTSKDYPYYDPISIIIIGGMQF
jgi:hypothetical protein